MIYNKVYAQIGEERHIVLDPINYQYDVKQILVLTGETVPDYYEADVCNAGDTATITMVGTAADGVEIPDKFLLDGRNVLVYVVIPGSGGDVQTRYDITIPVDERAEREDIDPSEAEQQQIDSLIAALNAGAAKAESAAEASELSAGKAADHATDAEAWAVGQRDGVDVDDEDQTYHNNSKYYAGVAEAAAEEAGRHEASWETWVQRAETAAGNAENSATAAGQSKTAAETAAQTATQKATEAGNSAAAAAGSASEARQTVYGAIGAINTARDGALSAIGQAGTTQVNAVNQAGTSQVSAVNQAGAAQVQAVEDKGNEVLDLIPQDYTDLVNNVADLSRQISDKQNAPATAGTAGQVLGLDDQLQPVWMDQTGGSSEDAAPVIINTASGDVASFADGADNKQIREIVGTIVPVQSGTGDPSPDNVRPISGWTGAMITEGSGNLLKMPVGTASNYGITAVSDGENLTLTGTVTSIYVWIALSSNNLAVFDAFTGMRNLAQTEPKFLKEYVQYIMSPFKVSGNTSVSPTHVYYFYEDGTNGDTTFDRAFTPTKPVSLILIRFIKNAVLDQTYKYSLTIGQNVQSEWEEPKTQQTLPINWQTEAGTIYGGTVTLNEDGSADVVAEYNKFVFDGSSDEQWSFSAGSFGGMGYCVVPAMETGVFYSDTNVICNNREKVDGNVNDPSVIRIGTTATNRSIYIYSLSDTYSITTLAGLKAWLSENPFEVTLKLATPQTYHFDNIGSLLTYYGQNNVWIDTGAITECDYPADTKRYIDGKIAEMQATILENIGG